MVRITEELIRKKSEHNENVISTLEELSLHQEDVEKIEYIHNWCRDIQILLLQSNLIPKIENLNKLKKLEYLNLAINNIEKVENLERCESLQKLDLTLNFIGDIESVCSLKSNIDLNDLYLTGNPCHDYDGYRQYVIANLPQLETLDGQTITKTERLEAIRLLPEIVPKVLEAQKNYNIFRQEQRNRLSETKKHLTDEEFWKSSSENAPETRVELSQRSRKAKSDEKPVKEKPKVRLFANNGRPLNVNKAKVDFKFSEDDPKQYVLDVATYKHLDTNLVEIDLQSTYVKIVIKGKVFQFVFPEEIHIDKSTAQRSQTTGHLVIKMPRVHYKEPALRSEKGETKMRNKKEPEFLDVCEANSSLDFSKIVDKKNDTSFKDDPNVPPLEYGTY